MSWWDESWDKKWLLVGNEDLLKITHSHWLQFEPPSCQQHLIFAILYAVVMIPGIFGNAVVIFLFFRSPNLRVPANVMSVNLAMADLIMNLEAPLLIFNSLQCGPKNFSLLACRLYGLSGGLAGIVAILSIAAMAIQRYISITRPFDCGKIVNMRNCLVIVCLTWIYAFTFSFMPVVGFLNSYVPEGYLTSCSFDYLSKDFFNQLFVILIFSAAYVVPLCVIFISYVLIVVSVRRTQQRFLKAITDSPTRYLNTISIHSSLKKPGQTTDTLERESFGPLDPIDTNSRAENISDHSSQPTSRKTSPVHSWRSCPAAVAPVQRPVSAASGCSAYQQAMIDSKAKTEMKLIRCAATLIFLWTVAWTPYAVIALLGVFSDASLITPLHSMLPGLFCKSASVIDPYVYSCSHPKYRIEIRNLFRRIFSHCDTRRLRRRGGRRQQQHHSPSISLSRMESGPSMGSTGSRYHHHRSRQH